MLELFNLYLWLFVLSLAVIGLEVIGVYFKHTFYYSGPVICFIGLLAYYSFLVLFIIGYIPYSIWAHTFSFLLLCKAIGYLFCSGIGLFVYYLMAVLVRDLEFTHEE